MKLKSGNDGDCDAMTKLFCCLSTLRMQCTVRNDDNDDPTEYIWRTNIKLHCIFFFSLLLLTFLCWSPINLVVCKSSSLILAEHGSRYLIFVFFCCDCAPLPLLPLLMLYIVGCMMFVCVFLFAIAKNKEDIMHKIRIWTNKTKHKNSFANVYYFCSSSACLLRDAFLCFLHLCCLFFFFDSLFPLCVLKMHANALLVHSTSSIEFSL